MKFKIYKHFIKVLPILLLSFTTCANIFNAQTCSGTANIPPNGTSNFNGITVISESTGFFMPYGAAAACNGMVNVSDGSIWAGLDITTGNSVDNAAWSTKLTFSKPVNNIIFVLTGAGPVNNEKFYFTSNGGTIAVTSTTNCFSTMSGNSITSGAGTVIGATQLGGGIFLLKAPAAFTTLTMSGLGGTYGSIIGICESSIKAACNAGTTAPPVNTSVTNICPATTVNLNTQSHTGTIPTNASLVWYTNNAHTGAAYATPTAANAGTYYAFYYDSVNNCYSPASSAVTVSIANCGFGCNNNMYLSQSNILYTITTATNPFTYPSVGTASAPYNAIGLNPLDGHIYGMLTPNSNNLLRINTNGTTTNLGAITNLPVATYNSGEIDNAGNYYVKGNTNNSQLYKINLSTKTATLINLTASFNTADFAYSITTGLLYGVKNDNGQLYSINPLTGTVALIGSTPGAVNFGAMYTSSTGEVFGVNNDGGFYQFNLTTGERVLISGAPDSTANDGAHCVTVPITFSADLAITKTDGTAQYTPGSSTTYTVTVTNNGPFGVLNAQVSDLVPAGIPAGNVSYTAVASAGSTTTVSGTQTGAINDLVGLPVLGTVTYNVVVNVPFSFTGSLVNTATVTPPANISDANMANNTATDTDTSGACYKPGITSGTVLDTKHGISALGRAGSENGNWPMVRKGAWTALESKTKGFVINRIATTAQVNAIANPIEGMMVYDEEADCLKIYTTTDSGATFSWKCFTKPTCAN